MRRNWVGWDGKILALLLWVFHFLFFLGRVWIGVFDFHGTGRDGLGWDQVGLDLLSLWVFPLAKMPPCHASVFYSTYVSNVHFQKENSLSRADESRFTSWVWEIFDIHQRVGTAISL